MLPSRPSSSKHSSKPVVIGDVSTSQKRSAIFEHPNEDGHRDWFLLSLFDPHCFDFKVLFLRFLALCGVYVFGFFATFGFSSQARASIKDLYGGIGVGGAVCVIAIPLCVLSLKRLYRSSGPDRIGKEMTHWLSWIVFTDIIYHALNPKNLIDCRETEFAKKNIGVHDESSHEGEYTLDFMADTGDGFNPTYSVFAAMARSSVEFDEPTDYKKNSVSRKLPRADAVIVGGDIAYPWPRYDDIMGRFVRVVAWAFPENSKTTSNPPRMFVMPGNHEWVDGLRNFRKLVLARDSIGAWRTPVNSPYFAIKLPHDWWYFAADTGHDLKQDLDDAQIAYFTNIVNAQTTPKDRFIFSNHVPDWIKNEGHGFKLFEKLCKFREEVLGDRLRLELAGDLHYYRRMEEAAEDSYSLSFAPNVFETNKKQLIVAGHGGAFAHPTFAPAVTHARLGAPFRVNAPLYVTKCDYPTPQDSKAMLKEGYLRGFSKEHNYGYGHILAACYMCLFMACSVLDYSSDNKTFPQSVKNDVFLNWKYLKTAFFSFYFWPGFLWIVVEHLIIATQAAALATWLEILQAMTLWLSHTACQLGFAALCRKAVDCLLVSLYLGGEPGHITFNMLIGYTASANLLTYACGYFLAPYVTAVYLYLGCVVFHFHYNEAFTLLEDQEHKGFLRMTFSSDGDVDIYSLGIVKTPRQWKERVDQSDDEFPGIFEPMDARLEVKLIEKITLKRNGPRNNEALEVV